MHIDKSMAFDFNARNYIVSVYYFGRKFLRNIFMEMCPFWPQLLLGQTRSPPKWVKVRFAAYLICGTV